MHAMSRQYSGKGAKELAKLLESRKGEIEKILKAVPGLISYNLIETADGCLSFTVCKDKAGADKSLAEARDWLKANASQLDFGQIVVSEGRVLTHLGADVAV